MKRPGVVAIDTEAGHVRALLASLSTSTGEAPQAVLTLVRSALMDLEDAAAYLAAYQRQLSGERNR